MSREQRGKAAPEREASSLRERLARRVPERLRGASIGPLALLIVSLLAIATVIWGNLRGAGLEVRYFDAGPLDDYAIGTVAVFPEEEIYVVGLADGRLRAIDGRVESSGCSVRYMREDDRGRALNPRGLPGVFEDPCTGATWAATGDALAGGNEPLRTPFVLIATAEDGRQRVSVELVSAED